MSPAEITRVEIEDKRAKVYVTEDQQSVAIGRQGQNVRLASMLTGIELDIELAEAPKKKKRANVEDSLLSALQENESEAEAVASEEAEESTEAEESAEAEVAAENEETTDAE